MVNAAIRLTSRDGVWNRHQALTTNSPPIMTRQGIHVGLGELFLYEMIVSLKGVLSWLNRGDTVVDHLVSTEK